MTFPIRPFALLLLFAKSVFASSWSDTVETELAGKNGNSDAPLAAIYRRAFLDDLPHRIIHFSDDAKQPTKEIFIGDGVAAVRSSKDWNVIADGTNFYVWYQGAATGTVAPQNAIELFRYLEGIINPTGMMGIFYCAHLADPKAFRTVEKGNVLEYNSLDPKAGIFTNWTFLQQKNPAWLLGFRWIDPQTKNLRESRISPPEHVSEIPTSFCTPPKEVIFSPGTINWSKDLIPYL
ncbi:hypothetical protein BH09VER1_BH09VER1_33060 [soil metagenome]